MLLLGHRGARQYATENSFDAFDVALEHGCDGFEFDVRRDVGPQGQASLLAKGQRSELYLASQDAPTPVFQF